MTDSPPDKMNLGDGEWQPIYATKGIGFTGNGNPHTRQNELEIRGMATHVRDAYRNGTQLADRRGPPELVVRSEDEKLGSHRRPDGRNVGMVTTLLTKQL